MRNPAVDPAGLEPVLDLRVIAGAPTEEELAAVTAVLQVAVLEQSADDAPLEAPDGRAWQRAHGFLRRPVVPGPGAWRSF